jgi:hypothetical protein
MITSAACSPSLTQRTLQLTWLRANALRCALWMKLRTQLCSRSKHIARLLLAQDALLNFGTREV